jgi:ubiquinone/menaquinone biosynthesis C-methylase UbiE
LYEFYLAALFEKQLGKHRPTIVCTDFSEEMTRIQKNIHGITKAKEGVVLDRVRMETQDMTNLRMKTKSVDQLICNNTLQWVPNWRQAIKEMARVVTPVKTGYIYIFLNENPMTSLSTPEGETVLELPNAPIDEIIETFEKNRFQIVASRHLTSPDGQNGMLQRRFFMAEYRAKGTIQPWKSVTPAQLGTSYTFTKKL